MGRSGVLILAFGAGWSPGIAPILGSILLPTGNAATLGRGILVLLAYALGLGLPFLLAALFVHGLAGHLRRVNRSFDIINLGAGALLVLMGGMV